MRKLSLLLMCLLAVHIASARLVVTEVMYHPSADQGGNYNEWVEFYNDGPAFELSNYFINGKSVTPANISANALFVVAEKLTGNGSLDSYYGNNDGVWDSSDPFFAVDASSFSLDDSAGFINLSNSLDEIFLNYDTSLGADGNGKTLEKPSLDSTAFVESSSVGGSPGYLLGNASSDGGLNVEVSISNAVPSINYLVLTPDDSPDPGFQVYPEYNNDKVVKVSAEVVDENGVNDLAKVVLDVSDKLVELASIEDLNSTSVKYSWNIRMKPDDRFGIYTFNVTATDSQGASAFNASQFDYSELLSIRVNSESINFGSLKPGLYSVSNITVRNTGNSIVDLEVSGTNLSNGETSIPVSKIEVMFGNEWLPLDTSPKTLDLNLAGSSSNDFSLRFNAPLGFKADRYSGTITLAAVRS